MKKLNKSQILLFYPYGATKHYGDSIKRDLESRGAIVFGYDERPSQNVFVKIVIRLFKKKFPFLFSLYIKKIIRLNRTSKIDYILVLRGEAFTKNTLSLLKKNYPDAITILYLWDVLKTTSLEDVIPYFDKAFSFDPEDVQKNEHLVFRPTFYMPEYKDVKKENSPEIDLLFIGTIHGDRQAALNSIKEYSEIKNLSYFFYLFLPSLFIYFKKKYIEGYDLNIRHIYFHPISLSKTIQMISNSKCVLDLNFKDQKSLSMRAFEAMASKTKYITTNPEVVKYDFYNENNIYVMDKEKIEIPSEFINSQFIDIPQNVLIKYSVSQLVDDLFS